MKRLCMCVAVLAMGIWLVGFVGCGKDGTDALRGVQARLEQQFRDGTVLLRMEGQIAQARDEFSKIRQ